MTTPVTIDSPEFTALAERWRHLTHLSLIPRLTPAEADELAAIVPIVSAALSTLPPQVHTQTHWFDSDVPDDADFVLARSLYATRSLLFVWRLPDNFSSLTLTSPDGVSRVYYRVTLAFYAWVRGVCRAEHREGKWPLPDEQMFAMQRIRSYICHRHGITDGDASKLPEPSDEFPE